MIADIHSNLAALEACLDSIGEAEIDEIWCLGDIVGYGPEPDACTELVRERCSLCLAGNHDLAVLDALDIESFSETAATAVRWTQGAVGAETLEFLRELEPSGQRERDRPPPRLPPRPDLGVRPHRRAGRCLPRRAGGADLRDRPLARRPLLHPPRRGPRPRPRRPGQRRDAARDRRRQVVGQPRQRRPATGRRPTGSLARARHRGRHRDVPSRLVRHRAHRGVDRRRRPAETARRPPLRRPLTPQMQVIFVRNAFSRLAG